MTKNEPRQSVEAELRQILDWFEAESSGLFQVTGRYEAVFEQGKYSCALASPSRRMKATLGVDREVLVVASTFRDQQQRTIKFIKREIEGSVGRLERTIAIVLHMDSEGNSKLKNWGRDQGISILPVYLASSSPAATGLEEILAVELYSHDPFDVTGPVSDDSNFFGRRDEAIDLARKLQQGQIRSCLGMRKVGKTSIINRILREIRENYDCLCIMVDCSRDDIWELTSSQLLDSLASSIGYADDNGLKYTGLRTSRKKTDAASATNYLLEAVVKRTVPTIVVFDEVDYITPGSPTRPGWSEDFNSFWRSLRVVYQECERLGQKVSLLVGGVSTYWFSVESIGEVENAALAFVPEEYLSPMPEGATVAMLKRLGRVAGISFEGGAAEHIAKATGNMPYWARKCCSYMQRSIPPSSRPYILSVEETVPLVDSFVAEEGAAIAEVALRHLFRVHPLLFECAKRCHANDSKSVPVPLLRSLRKYGVLSSRDQVSGAMIQRAMDSLVAVASLPNMEEESLPRSTELGEWAEEIAAISKRRNLLERKLREIALNFIRYDALNKGKIDSLKDRVLAVIPEGRRVKLKHMTAEDAIGKFNWTDLTTLVVREWELFSRLFPNKRTFEENCEIVNERYDAHAKSADQADFALYRRALTQLETPLGKV